MRDRIYLKRFICLFVIIMMTFLLNSCFTQDHICESECISCGGCTDARCGENACSEKCCCSPEDTGGSNGGTDIGGDGTGGENTDTRLESTVSYIAPPEGVALYSGARVFIEDTEIALYEVKVNNSQAWPPDNSKRDSSGVGYFNLTGRCQVRVEIDGMTSCTVRPLSAKINAKCSNGVATFEISSSGNYAIEPDGDPERAFFLFVSTEEEKEEPTGQIIRFTPGIHSSENSQYIKNNTVTLGSNTTVILEEGAVVRARFVASNAENIKIVGKGIIDGSVFERDLDRGLVTVPLDFNYCRNVVFNDFSVLDPAGWCVNWYFCRDSQIDGIKIISSRANGDGISLQSCMDIDVRNCFLRTWDDTLVVKNYPKWSDRAVEGETRNILFENCTLWTDLAQSMEIGYETVGEVLENVTFRSITVLHNFHKPVMSIHNGNNANVKDILFDTVTVEDASVISQSLCEFSVAFSSTWSSQHKVTGLGSISGVTVKNITVLSCASSMALRVSGSVDTRAEYNGSVHTVSDVTFENIWLKNRQITSDKLRLNKYAEAEIINGDERIICEFIFDRSAEETALYKDHAVVRSIE